MLAAAVSTISSALGVPVLSNKSIDTDVVSAGFPRLLSAGHLRR
jgi:hypothetical protein